MQIFKIITDRNRHKKKPCKYQLTRLFSGKGGIQTPGTFQYGGFQDRCNRSLCHLSKSAFL